MLNGTACVRIQIAAKKRQAIFFIPPLQIGMGYVPFKIHSP